MKMCARCGSVPTRSPCPTCAGAPRSVAVKASATAALLLGLVACPGPEQETAVPLYGVPDTGFLDEDGDGFRARDDCDDNDPERYPGARETPDDGIDSNCDGDDNT